MRKEANPASQGFIRLNQFDFAHELNANDLRFRFSRGDLCDLSLRKSAPEET